MLAAHQVGQSKGERISSDFFKKRPNNKRRKSSSGADRAELSPGRGGKKMKRSRDADSWRLNRFFLATCWTNNQLLRDEGESHLHNLASASPRPSIYTQLSLQVDSGNGQTAACFDTFSQQTRRGQNKKKNSCPPFHNNNTAHWPAEMTGKQKQSEYYTPTRLRPSECRPRKMK